MVACNDLSVDQRERHPVSQRAMGLSCEAVCKLLCEALKG